VTEHEALPPVPSGAHEVVENVPVAPLDQDTVPVGRITLPASVSATVAVQDAATPTGTGVPHTTVVAVVRSLAVSVAPPPLGSWTPPPS
jgi:hypothetical protein